MRFVNPWMLVLVLLVPVAGSFWTFLRARSEARLRGLVAPGLQAALDEIDQLEKTTLDRTVFQRYREFFPPFLFAGAILVLAAVSLQMAASRRLV